MPSGKPTTKSVLGNVFSNAGSAYQNTGIKPPVITNTSGAANANKATTTGNSSTTEDTQALADKKKRRLYVLGMGIVTLIALALVINKLLK